MRAVLNTALLSARWALPMRSRRSASFLMPSFMWTSVRNTPKLFCMTCWSSFLRSATDSPPVDSFQRLSRAMDASMSDSEASR